MLCPTVFLLILLARIYVNFKNHNAFLGNRTQSINPSKCPSFLGLCVKKKWNNLILVLLFFY